MSTDEKPTKGKGEGKALSLLRSLFQSGRPILYIHSAEERRVATLLRSAAKRFFKSPVPVYTWSLTDGLRREGEEARALSPREVLDFVIAHEGAALFHLEDFHAPMQQDEVLRRLRDVYAACSGSGKVVVISSPVRFAPDEIARDVAYLELPLPDHAELVSFLRAHAKRVAEAGGNADQSEETLADLARALQGLTLEEARHAIRRALGGDRRLDRSSADALLEEKKLVINRTGLVECVDTDIEIGDVGGLSALRDWLTSRRKLFHERETVEAEIVPKGILVMGIAGCGKSLSVKSIASCFGLPLYRIDLTAVFSGRHGNPESAFVSACRMLEQVAPAVVWFDEIEMGVTTHGDDPSGELGRIFAFFLTWMQEKPRGLFVAATANRIDLLPAEMIRKGRFDEVFFVDLPVPEERVEIFGIHLKRRGIDPTTLDLPGLVRFSERWSGAEVEQCVVSALTRARLQDRPLEYDDLLHAAARIVPLAKTMKEQIDQIRNWAYDRAVPARPDDITGGVEV